jgi:hypothetical protein
VRSLLALTLVAGVQIATSAAAAALLTYSLGTIPVAGGQGDVEFPLTGEFRGQVGVFLLS